MYRFGKIQRKIMIALLGGVALGMSRSPGQYYKVVGAIKRDWKRLNKSNLDRSVNILAKEEFVKEKRLKDGSIKLILTAKGKIEAKKLKLIGNVKKFKKPKKWDNKWRVVVFDIPEKNRVFRGILRKHLYNLDFYKLQNSVFVSPYPVEKTILELSKLYSAEKYVRVITALKVDNEAGLKKIFFNKNN